jgi:hypothetical protein
LCIYVDRPQAYFKFIPLKIALPLLCGAALMIKLNNDMKIKRAERAMDDIVDDAIMQEIEKEEEWQVAKTKKAATKKQNKAEAQVRQRLKEEKKSEYQEKTTKKKSKAGADDDDDDDIDALLTFVKGSRETQNKKKK